MQPISASRPLPPQTQTPNQAPKAPADEKPAESQSTDNANFDSSAGAAAETSQSVDVQA